MADNNSFIPNPHESFKPLACITFTNVTKLLPNNYPNWKQQVEALLDGYDLLQYPDGSFPAPSETILTAPTSSTPTPSETTPTTASLPVTTQNPAYQTWRRQDRLIYGALLTTLSNEVASLVSQTKTSHDLWILLKNTYAKASRKPFLGRCQWCNIKGHVLSECKTFQQQHPSVPPPPRNSPAHTGQVQVNTATAGPSQHDFLFDSGATHHVTNDLDNLALHHPYTGPDSLFMGNGSGLNITHSGTLLLNDLSLSNALCVPSMKQKIISSSTEPTNPTQSPPPTSQSSPQLSAPPPQTIVNPNGGGIITRSKNNIIKPIQKLNLHVQASSPIEPNTITQALRDPDWRSAMQAEFDALHHNNTWDLVSRSSDQNLVGCKWVFRIKRNPDGSIDRYKARLVVKGFHQHFGWDYTETFSPVVKLVTIRIVLTLAVRQGWPIRQLDVNNAFLQGTLKEEVFMIQPPGFVNKNFPDHVCRLKKALYGLKQAPRAWYTELRVFLLSLGFVNSTADASLFIYKKPEVTLYLLVYVDDIIMTGNSSAELSKLIATLAARFSLKDLGRLSYFLGVEVIPSAAGMFLSQRKYIIDLLHKSGMTNTKPASTPLSASVQLLKDSGDLLPSPKEYRTLVGSLQYLSLTRPDIAFSTNKLAQFMQNPRTTHWSALKRVLRYLAGSCDKGVFISATVLLTFHAYSDADWAGDKDDYVSTTGYLLYLELGHMPTANPVIYCDNLGATNLSANPVFHSRMKHIALAYHFVREHVQHGKFRVSFVSTDDQLANILTKPLLRPRFESLLSKLHLSSRLYNLREDINHNN
ncbi:Beta-carotene isomerase D27, chloroplastic isoform D [Glycine soja]|uniref:Beta-carotene isomerase D27, chloroplastic isoform D n=1 Tax=Glycine soja TaxID=3848 RepID=A0A445LLA6_GLYSO|nr:Beta-carotene isomerase D27, chloroplastic isoform D [Glycine soja]